VEVVKENQKIIIYNPTDFNVVQTLECGQIFRYEIKDNTAVVFSKDKKADLTWDDEKIEIKTKDVDYFFHFFDLDNDYSKIKKELSKDDFLRPAVHFGYGIRILNNDPFEMIISFIISANNNIKRIKNSVKYLSEHYGENKGDYFAFPTLEGLKKVSIEELRNAGLGFRDKYVFETCQKLTKEWITSLKVLSLEEKRKKLVELKGIGEKVANCILLFGLEERRVFPVDTWIVKVYNNLMKTNEKDAKKMTKILTDRYGELSGYAQQYFYYFYRENKLS